jgi:hypothetical protein
LFIRKLTWYSLALLLTASLIWALTGCRPPEETTTPTVPPPPEASSLAPVVSQPPTTPPAAINTTPGVGVDNTSADNATAAALPAGIPVQPVQIDQNIATLIFPDNITFALKGHNSQIIKTIFLEYGTDVHSLSDQTTRTRVDFQENRDFSVSWNWEMKKRGSLPPGVNIWWQWILTDVAGRSITVPRDTLKYTDTRYSWQVKKTRDMDLYWYTNEATMYQLADVLQSHLERLQLNITIPAERKPQVYVYATSEELRKAVLSTHNWTGALAFPDYNIILTAVNGIDADWAKDALPHEIAHLMVGEATFGPFETLPLWLNEGIAEYTRGSMSTSELEVLKQAVKSDKLPKFTSLNNSFPVSAAEATLAYLESRSMVNYLIDKYGWEKMRSLLALFKTGTTADKGLLSIFSLDVSGLETAWRATLNTP